MSEFRKLSDKISIDDSGINEVFLVNGQWQFTLPDGLSYETDGEFTFIEGGIDLSGSTKPLVLKEGWSLYDQSFCAAVEPHYSFTGDHMTIIDCKYDNRFGPNNGMNSQRVIIDEPGFYVDLISVNTWPFGVEAQIRVRGDDIDPFNITMMVKPEGDEHWQHIADYFREIAGSICIAEKTTKKSKATNRKKTTIDDPNCIMSGTVLERYIGWDADVVLPDGITELADNIFSGRDGLRSMRPIIWRVLQKEENELLLQSRYALEVLPMHAQRDAVNWKDCDLRKWLNGLFYAVAFDDLEKAKICTVFNRNPRNPQYQSGEDPITEDKVFLLSWEEYTAMCNSVSKDLDYTDHADVGHTLYGKGRWFRTKGKHKTQFAAKEGRLDKPDGFACDADGAVYPVIRVRIK